MNTLFLVLALVVSFTDKAQAESTIEISRDVYGHYLSVSVYGDGAVHTYSVSSEAQAVSVLEDISALFPEAKLKTEMTATAKLDRSCLSGFCEDAPEIIADQKSENFLAKNH